MKRAILVTGAEGNLGRAAAKKCIEEGYEVVGTQLHGEGGVRNGVDFFSVNLVSAEDTAHVFGEIFEKYHLAGAVFSVGGFGMNNLSNATQKDLNKMFDLNFMTALNSAREVAKHLEEQGGGTMVFIGAKPALEGGASEVLPYAISKAAVIKLAEIINEGTNKTNVKAAVVVPSIIDTPPNRESMPNANFDEWVTPESLADVIWTQLSAASKDVRSPLVKVYGKS